MKDISNYEVIAVLTVVILKKINWLGFKYELKVKFKGEVPDSLKSFLKPYVFKDRALLSCKKQEFNERKINEEMEIFILKPAFSLINATESYLNPKISYYIN